MRPPRVEIKADPAYWRAFAELMSRIDTGLGDFKGPPVPVYVAGGAAAHLYTGSRLSADIDATIPTGRTSGPSPAPGCWTRSNCARAPRKRSRGTSGG